MRLIILDSDEDYLKSIRVVISSQMEEYIEVFTLSTLEDLSKLDHLIGSKPFLLINEQFMTDISLSHEYTNILRKNNFAILTEGITSRSVFSRFFIKIDPKYASEDLDKQIIMKYQAIKELLVLIKDSYLTKEQSKLNLGHRETHLISLYHPYGKLTTSKLIETTLKEIPPHYKSLIIHYDPFYKAKTKNKFNLSYLFTLVKRNKKDLSLSINEIKERITYNLDVINGPGNMLDIDCLTKEELNIYSQNLLKHLNYDYIFLNFNGLHISHHVMKLLENSTECILCHEEEDVQLSVIRQTDITWCLMMNDLKQVLQEVMKKHGKNNSQSQI